MLCVECAELCPTAFRRLRLCLALYIMQKSLFQDVRWQAQGFSWLQSVFRRKTGHNIALCHVILTGFCRFPICQTTMQTACIMGADWAAMCAADSGKHVKHFYLTILLMSIYQAPFFTPCLCRYFALASRAHALQGKAPNKKTCQPGKLHNFFCVVSGRMCLMV